MSEQVLKKQIGEGSIGKVHLGKWRETDVAVKILNSLSSIGVAESPEAMRAGPLATLEREVRCALPLHADA